MSLADTHTANDFDLVSHLVVSGAHCIGCLARKSEIPADLLMAWVRHMEDEWGDPMIDTDRCSACRATATVYALRIP